MRKDGTRIKDKNIEYIVSPHIMPDRNDALNMVEIDIPEEPIRKYLNSKRKQGVNLSHLSVVLTALARTIGEYPKLNQFIVNKKTYMRNKVVAGMVVLKSGDVDNSTTSKFDLNPADTVFAINDKINEYIESNRKNDSENGTEKLANFLVSVPGLLRFGVNLLKFLDKHGLLPNAAIEASPFHATFMLSNLASIRTSHVFHHIYNFGTISMLITMGIMREVPKKAEDGTIIMERCIPFGIVMDERICSGGYYSRAFRKFKKYLENPAMLETPPENTNKNK